MCFFFSSGGCKHKALQLQFLFSFYIPWRCQWRWRWGSASTGMLIPGLEKLEVPSRTPGKVTILTDPKNNTLPSHKAEMVLGVEPEDPWCFEMANITLKCKFVCIFNRLFTFNFGAFKQMIFIDFDQPNFSNILRIVSTKGLGCFGPELGSLAFQRLKLTRCWALPWHSGLVLPWHLGVERLGLGRALHSGSFPGCLVELRGATVWSSKSTLCQILSRTQRGLQAANFCLWESKNMQKLTLKKQGGGGWEGVSSWLNLFVPKMGCRTWRSAVFSRSWGSTRSMESLVARTWLDSAIAARDEEALQQWLGNYTVPVVSQALVAFARAYATWLYRMYQRLADWTPPCLWGMCRVSNLGCISRARLGS